MTHPPLRALFATLLAGCPIASGPGAGDTEKPPPEKEEETETGDYGPACTTYEVALTGEEVAAPGGDTGDIDASECLELCALAEIGYLESCEVLSRTEDGGAILACEECIPYEGRRTAGLCHAPTPRRGDTMARWLARAAHAEAASVPAFLRLRAELTAHHAPTALRDAALVAARDEVRHARTMRALTRAHGARPPRARVRLGAPRPLAEVARENAVEGCVNETWAALTALHQARHATDPALRAALRRIAGDEVRHAELAWAVDAWARTRLSPDDVAGVDGARRKAARALAALRHPEDPRLGLPSPAAVARLHAGLRALWAA